MRFIDILVPAVVLATFLVSSAQAAPKIYINPSDQIHNFSPDKTYCEADNMQDVARRLEAKLKARGFEVQNSNGATMAESCAAANAWPADIFISLHSNAAGSKNSGKAHGTNTLYFLPRDGSEPNPISVKLALLCDEKCVEKFTTYGRGHNFAVTADLPFLTYNLYVLRKTEMPGTLVEGLFHDNEEDTAVLKTEEGRDAYAQAVYEALCDHFEWSYYPDAPILDPVGPVVNDSEGRLVLAIRGNNSNAGLFRLNASGAAGLCEGFDLEGDIDGDPVIARNANGRLQAFAMSGGRVRHKVQASAGSDRWNGWYDLGGHTAAPPVVARNADGRLVVFAIGSDGHLRYRSQRAPGSALQWDGWQDLGSGFQDAPLVYPQADGRLVVVCSTGDVSAGWTVQMDAHKWDKWHVLDNHADGNVGMVRDGSGRIALFASGRGGRVLYRMQNGSGWGDWQDIGGRFFGNTAVGVSTDGRFEVFGIDIDGVVSHNSQASDGKWTGWQSLGGSFTGFPVVGRTLDGRVVVFARDKDGKVQYRVQREPSKSAIWDGWYTLGEPFKATVREYSKDK